MVVRLSESCLWKSKYPNRAIHLHAVEAEDSWHIANLALGEKVERVWIVRAGQHGMRRGGEDQYGKDLAAFSRYRTTEVMEIDGSAQANPLKDKGCEVTFVWLRDLRQVIGKHRNRARRNHSLSHSGSGTSFAGRN